MDKNILIGFDFSINKPAMTVLYNNKYYHYYWPLKKLSKKHKKLYEEAEVTVYPRNLESISKKNTDSNLLVVTHTIRSVELCNKIIEDIILLFNKLNIGDDYNLYICSEGLSFGSKGDATLNLATYKGVLLSKLYETFISHLKGLYTYPPISIKSTAGCATKELISDKNKMIEKYIHELNDITLREKLAEGKMKGKVRYIAGVDDIVDSYWAILTMLRKENLPFMKYVENISLS